MIFIPLEIQMLRSISSESAQVTGFESHGLQLQELGSARFPLGSLVSSWCHIWWASKAYLCRGPSEILWWPNSKGPAVTLIGWDKIRRPRSYGFPECLIAVRSRRSWLRSFCPAIAHWSRFIQTRVYSMYLYTVLCTGMGIIKSHNSTPVKNAKMIEMIAVHCRCNKDSAGTARYVMLKRLFCCFLVLQHKFFSR